MQIELTHSEVVEAIEAIDMRRDSAIDTKGDITDPTERIELDEFIAALAGIINKLQNALIGKGVAKKKKASGTHKCYTLTNDSLKSCNAQLALGMQFDMKTGEAEMVLGIPLKKLDSKNRKRLPFLQCTFCPICGERLITPELKDPQ